MRNITLSIVSHGQAHLVRQLLDDIDNTGAGLSLSSVVLTCNYPEEADFTLKSAPVQVKTNTHLKGFGTNHNAAFEVCESDYYCIVNPDIRLASNPFPALLSAMQAESAAVAGPKVRNSQGQPESSARPLPTLAGLVKKALGMDAATCYAADAIPRQPDWIAGMFMLFNSSAYAAIGGFDEKYHLYYEDVDICLRLRDCKHVVLYAAEAEVIHDARRTSHKNLRYLLWHLSSIMRYFTKHFGQLPWIDALRKSRQ